MHKPLSTRTARTSVHSVLNLGFLFCFRTSKNKMPPKKRKMSQSTDGSVGDDTSPASTPKIKRRKKPTIQYDPVSSCCSLD